MIMSPILPLWLVIPIFIVLIVLIVRNTKGTKLIIRILMIVLLFIINLRFKIPNGEVTVLNTNLDIIFVVDTTLSMNAKDCNGDTRMSHVHEDLKYIVDKLGGSTYSLITYDSIKTVIPFTYDSVAIKNAIDIAMPPDELYAQGSTITAFKSELEKQLNTSNKKENRQRIVFLVSDGEDTNGSGLEDLSSFKSLIQGGAVLGYGTTAGGKIEVVNYSGEKEYLKDRTTKYPYSDALSKIDEDNLRKMASDLGLDYIHVNNQNDLNSIISKVEKVREFSNNDQNKSAYQDVYFYLSPFLLVLFTIELIMDRRLYQ